MLLRFFKANCIFRVMLLYAASFPVDRKVSLTEWLMEMSNSKNILSRRLVRNSAISSGSCGFPKWLICLWISLSSAPIPSVPPQSAVTPENSSFCDPNRAWELPSRACAQRYWQMSWREETNCCSKKKTHVSFSKNELFTEIVEQ